jgi:uncharacterized protein (TIGR04255 family)
MSKNPEERNIYKNAPIIEAAISLKFIPSDYVNFDVLYDVVSKNLSNDYPIIEKTFENEFKLECGETPRSTSTQQCRGFRLISRDKKQVIQITGDGFTFSRLSPYGNWELLRDQTKKALEIYQQATNHRILNRVGVRFINRFDLPGGTVQLSDYLNIFPQIPSSQNISGLAMQVISTQLDIKSVLVISQALIPPKEPNTISLILDLDLFNTETRDIQDLWDFLEVLHKRKNKFFESAITKKTREMIS